jgi:hypothetical protein
MNSSKPGTGCIRHGAKPPANVFLPVVAEAHTAYRYMLKKRY